ncbi:hypothetical protein [Vibrio vulnificus]|uniref:hypothetical protein n=1 Tax=Vibrio vulnificus TaxID=672 RepID=UPI0010295632|nr:hypothetical protein [Vibrio vulnificus]RZQ00201.1 hypothetical protein D8T54_03920 [Vibrio vulnificus]
MAILNDRKLNGVNLPYVKILSYSGNKDSIDIVTSRKVSQEFEGLHNSCIELTAEDSSEISDKVTQLLYEELKSKGYLVGVDC